MNRKFEMPAIEIDLFDVENIVTISNGNVSNMQKQMESDGYSVTTMSLSGFNF